MDNIKELLDSNYDQLWKEVTFKLKAFIWLKEQNNDQNRYYGIYYNDGNIGQIAKMYLQYKMAHTDLGFPENWRVNIYREYIEILCEDLQESSKDLENNPFN
jgi:hypothetical protein